MAKRKQSWVGKVRARLDGIEWRNPKTMWAILLSLYLLTGPLVAVPMFLLQFSSYFLRGVSSVEVVITIFRVVFIAIIIGLTYNKIILALFIVYGVLARKRLSKHMVTVTIILVAYLFFQYLNVLDGQVNLDRNICAMGGCYSEQQYSYVSDPSRMSSVNPVNGELIQITKAVENGTICKCPTFTWVRSLAL